MRINRVVLLLLLFFTLTQIYFYFLIEISYFGFFLLLITLITRFLYSLTINISNDLPTLMIWLYIEFGFLVGPFLINVLSSGSPLIINESFIFSYHLGEVTLLSFFIITIIFHYVISSKSESHRYHWENISKQKLAFLAIIIVSISFFVSYIASYLNIAGLEEKQPEIPGDIDGAINLYRTTAGYFFFIFILDVYHEKKMKKHKTLWIFIYLIWLIYETIIRTSKGGTLLSGLIPLIFWAYYRNILTKRFLKKMVPLILIIFITYPIMSKYRELKASSSKISYNQIVAIIKNKDINVGDLAINIYDRMIYRNAKNIDQFYTFYKYKFNNRYLFWNLDDIREAGNSVKYHTHVIDNVPRERAHSSGITGFSEGYLIGGIIFLEFTLIIFSFIATLICKKGRYWNPIIYVLLFSLLYRFIMGGMWHYITTYRNIIIWGAVFIFFILIQKKYVIYSPQKMRLSDNQKTNK